MFIRPLPVESKTGELIGYAEGNLREALRFLTKFAREHAGVHYSGGTLVYGGSKLDRRDGNELEDFTRQPWNSWKWNRKTKWRK